jgi:hypothetical protein
VSPAACGPPPSASAAPAGPPARDRERLRAQSRRCNPARKGLVSVRFLQGRVEISMGFQLGVNGVSVGSYEECNAIGRTSDVLSPSPPPFSRCHTPFKYDPVSFSFCARQPPPPHALVVSVYCPTPAVKPTHTHHYRYAHVDHYRNAHVDHYRNAHVGASTPTAPHCGGHVGAPRRAVPAAPAAPRTGTPARGSPLR